MRILVADDEPAVRDSLERSLGYEGHTVTLARDGVEALDLLQQTEVDVLILDVQMPRLDGLGTCRRLRASGNRIPILMLTARDGTIDKVGGLDAGADDYLAKPFALEELLARLRALDRRSRVGNNDDSPLLVFEDLSLDAVTREVKRGGTLLTLTRTEFSLLELFLRHPRQVLTRPQILEAVWGYDFGTGSNSLEVYIGYLRRKTEPEGTSRLVHTVRGVGYVLKHVPTPAEAE